MTPESNKVLLFIDDQPITVCEGSTITTDGQDLPPLAPAVEEWVIECHGLKYPERTRQQMLDMEWYRSAHLPRKKKKVYRKKIRAAMIAEWYRERVDHFLSMLGPEMR